MANATHYDTLCVAPTAPPEEIKKSWRRLVRNFHPDTAGDAGVVMTQRLNAAYSIVGSPDSRRAYDRDLLLDAEPQPEASHQPAPQASHQPQPATAPTAPRAPAAPSSPWEPERYRSLCKIALVCLAIIGIGIIVGAASLNSTHSSIWLAPIAAAAILTAARQKMARWRAAVLGIAIVAAPLGAIGVWVFSGWLADAGPVALIAQALVASAAFVAHSVGVPIRALRAAKPRK
ncbi:J domain-containing protein [Frigoribacterium sp. UYMn621]|uniref:J domain-containing protein n=1 Tax=Frigoribacterium sp. UYMn621 TaxID=3156343 RepID=UPI0033911DC5